MIATVLKSLWTDLYILVGVFLISLPIGAGLFTGATLAYRLFS